MLDETNTKDLIDASEPYTIDYVKWCLNYCQNKYNETKDADWKEQVAYWYEELKKLVFDVHAFEYIIGIS